MVDDVKGTDVLLIVVAELEDPLTETGDTDIGYTEVTEPEDECPDDLC